MLLVNYRKLETSKPLRFLLMGQIQVLKSSVVRMAAEIPFLRVFGDGNVVNNADIISSFDGLPSFFDDVPTVDYGVRRRHV